MGALGFLERLNVVVAAAIGVLYGYQVIYLAVGLLLRRRRDRGRPGRLRRYAALISARNEEEVIAQLIASLRVQNYPAELLDVYVVADNCTDDTAGAARRAGAVVYRRFDRRAVGKGYALDYLLKRLARDGLESRYEGYFVFDADNIVDPNFVSEMNRTFDRGDYVAVTGYRNAKNFGQNWITAGYAVWFLREARFVNSARMALGVSCAVSGTGFLVSAAYLREKGGWPWHLLTEDIQFSAQCVAEGRSIGYCEGAVIYDEQPASLRQSWDQRLRWSKGFYQVGRRCGPSLLRGILRGGRQGLGCYDILLTVTPGVLLTAAAGVLQGAAALACLSAPASAARQVLALVWRLAAGGLWGYYRGMLLYGLLAVLSEWRRIRATPVQKLLYLPLFPLFMLTYFPITVAALFQKVEWKPIRHSALARLDRAA